MWLWQTNDNQKKKRCFISKSTKIFKFCLRCTHKAYYPIWSISSSEAYILIKVCSIIPKWNEICGIRRTKARQNKVKLIILLQFRSEMKKVTFFDTFIFKNSAKLPYIVNLTFLRWMCNSKNVANLLPVWERALLWYEKLKNLMCILRKLELKLNLLMTYT